MKKGICGHGGNFLIAGLLAAGLLLTGTGAPAGELLPFPASQKRSLRQPIREAPYLAEYRKKIRSLECDELQSLRDALLGKARDAGSRDRRYYMSLVRVVDEIRDGKTCP
ncbi:hypothetical protein ACLG6S_01620 [Thermodesulfobacteriota bacterium B35]